VVAMWLNDGLLTDISYPILTLRSTILW